MASEQTPAEHRRRLDERTHILDGLVRVMDDPHRFLDVVLASDDTPEAIEALHASFGLSEVQAVAALDMQFRRLGTASQSRIRLDLDDLHEEGERLTRL